MSVDKMFPRFEPYSIQSCPLCGRDNIMVVNGYVSVHNTKVVAVPDQGYSFCNCKNVWYTNWKNIDQTNYFDSEYSSLHYRERYRKEIERLFKEYKPMFEQYGNGGKKLVDLGCVVDFFVDAATAGGYDATGLDITKHKLTKCKFIIADFDRAEIEDKFDIVVANHFIEHLHYPERSFKKMYNMLNDGGLLFVSAPDPFQVNWDMPERWSAWAVRQHYIMWDMDSLIEEYEARGFKLLYKKRNIDVRWLQDYHLLFKK